MRLRLPNHRPLVLLTLAVVSACGAESGEPPETVEQSATTSPMQGDVDGNGVVNSLDATRIAEYFIGKNVGPVYVESADVNCDGQINMGDALLIGQYVNKTISKFPCVLAPPDPSLPGSSGFSTVVYASSGAQKIPRYLTPTAGYQHSRRLNITPFNSLIDQTYWGFGATSVPINGIACVPSGTGPFPLAVIAHGNHDFDKPSEAGYRYLCEMLASQGVLMASVDANFLNVGVLGAGMDDRTILLLEHVRQFALWNAQTGHPLKNKVDLTRVMLLGHSMGGGAAAFASYYNTQTQIVPDRLGVQTYDPTPVPLDGSRGFGPYRFGIKGVVGLAPSHDVDLATTLDANYLVLQGSNDEQIPFVGMRDYNWFHRPNLADPRAAASGSKSMVYIYGAYHAFFNSDWLAIPVCPSDESRCVIPRTDQEKIAKTYVSAFARVHLLGDLSYRRALVSHAHTKSWLPQLTYVSEYHDKTRLFINHYEEDSNQQTISPAVASSPPVTGRNEWNFATGAIQELDLLTPPSQLTMPQDTRALRVSWTTLDRYYRVVFDGVGLDCLGFEQLAFRVGQSAETGNTAGQNQDFSLVIADTSGRSTTLLASQLGALPYPHPGPYATPEYDLVLQTVRVPMSTLVARGIDVRHLRSIRFAFNRRSSGVLYLDDLQLTN